MSEGVLPRELDATMRRAVRLEYWNVFWTLTVIGVMGTVLGQSQTMKTAWVEDTLGLVPPLAFLIAAKLERRQPSTGYPFGFARANGLGFFVAAVALFSVGALLLWDSVSGLIAAEHATVGSVVIFGHEVWLGWLMLAAQAYSLIPPYIIGRKELPLARELNDKLLHTDALMNKANWLTGAAGFFGVIGLGLGWWWADSLAAAIISLDIIHDGWSALRSSTAELVDGAPRALDSSEISDDAKTLQAELATRYPGAEIRLRETGRLIRAEVDGVAPPANPPSAAQVWPGDPDRAWRLDHLGFSPAGDGSSQGDAKPD